MWLPLISRAGVFSGSRRRGFRDLPDPGAGRVDQHAGRCGLPLAARIEHQVPVLAALGADQPRAGADIGAALGGVERVEHDEARVIHPAVGKLEPGAEDPLHGLADRIVGEIDGARRRQHLAAAEMVVDEQAEPQQQRRAPAGQRRQHETQRPDDVRRHAQQHLALGERLVHQPEGGMLEIAKAAVDQLGRGRGGAGGEIVLLDQQHAQAAAGGVAGNPRAVDAAADDGEVEVGHGC